MPPAVFFMRSNLTIWHCALTAMQTSPFSSSAEAGYVIFFSAQVVLEGVRGPGIEGDIAIDDITLEEGECRDPPPSELQHTSLSLQVLCLPHRTRLRFTRGLLILDSWQHWTTISWGKHGCHSNRVVITWMIATLAEWSTVIAPQEHTEGKKRKWPAIDEVILVGRQTLFLWFNSCYLWLGGNYAQKLLKCGLLFYTPQMNHSNLFSFFVSVVENSQTSKGNSDEEVILVCRISII